MANNTLDRVTAWSDVAYEVTIDCGIDIKFFRVNRQLYRKIVTVQVTNTIQAIDPGRFVAVHLGVQRLICIRVANHGEANACPVNVDDSSFILKGTETFTFYEGLVRASYVIDSRLKVNVVLDLVGRKTSVGRIDYGCLACAFEAGGQGV
ncbi:hypothetical protein K431DRAFT_297845 [Polychaeton citri CBS 116435]|uniref:Uncharacterized protein n=1 Tax=Polychaeton citri CBS 116435 TaxID=1314669 RepID=A0A9P4PYM2_9PEZI|nr:hypothetical protein K431DRAFT_297845 [Polychaeton citri CBS 116435]